MGNYWKDAAKTMNMASDCEKKGPICYADRNTESGIHILTAAAGIAAGLWAAWKLTKSLFNQ